MTIFKPSLITRTLVQNRVQINKQKSDEKTFPNTNNNIFGDNNINKN